MEEAYRVFALTRWSQFPYKWNPVTGVTSERTAYNELKIDEREREREWKSESTEFPRVIKGSRSCLANNVK